MEVIFATQNDGKFREVREKFRRIGIEVKRYDKGYPEIQADTLEEVAIYGIKYLSKRIDKPFFLEDAGLFIKSLNGFPGVYSAYVFKKIGCDGILKLMEGVTDREAMFKSVVAYKERGKRVRIFVGECKGRISTEKRGSKGFGFDPIFYPEGATKTFGEMDASEKNMYSHRGKSIQMLIEYLTEKKNR